MGTGLAEILSVPVYRALDTDRDGNVLIGTDESGTMQLLELSNDGIATALTALDGACTGRYLPGRRAVLVGFDDRGDENAQLSTLDLVGTDMPADRDQLRPLVHDPRFVHRVTDVTDTHLVYLTNRRNRVDFDIVVRDLDSGAERIAYTGGGGVADAALAPNARWLAFTRSGRPALSDQLVLLDLATGEVQPLTDADQPDRYLRPRFTDDGGLVVTTNRGRDLTGLARYDLDTGGWSWLAEPAHHDLSAWLSPDGSMILVAENDDGACRVSLRGPAGTAPRVVALPAIGCIDSPLPEPRWAPDGSAVLVSFSGPTVPGDALRVDAATGAVTVLTASARHLPSRLSDPSSHRITTADGESVPCFLYPAAAGAPADRAGSVVLHLHGGPEEQAKRTFSATIAALTHAGHAVVVPNVRGSTGYGKRWYSMDDGRRRFDAFADLAAVHAYLPSLGLDPKRAALWGASYGGYLVLAGLAFQPRLWAAGVDIVGISSLVTFLEHTSPYRRATREREYGTLARDREFLVEASPMTRIDDVRAPLFVIHGRNDPRVPVSEAAQLYDAVIANGVECELHVFDDEGHGLTKRANKVDAYARAFEFLGRHLS